MDPMVGSDPSKSTTNCENSNPGLIDLCEICNHQYFEGDSCDGMTGNAFKIKEIIKIFLSDYGNEENSLLQICTSCKNLIENLNQAKETLSSLIEELTNLLLHNSRFSYLKCREKIISNLFHCHEDNYYTESALIISEDNENIDMKSDLINSNKLELDGRNTLTSSGNSFHAHLSLDQNNTLIVTLNNEPHMNISNCEIEKQNNNMLTSIPIPIASSGDIKTTVENLEIISLPSHQSFHHQEQSSTTISGTTKEYTDHSGNFVIGLNSLELQQVDTNNIHQNVSQPHIIDFNGCTLEYVKTEEKLNNINNQRNITITKNSSQSSQNNSSYILPSSPTNIINNVIVPTTKIKKYTFRKVNGKKIYDCTLCDRMCRTPKELDLHLGSHTKEKKYVCELCGLAYRHKRALDVHLGLHRGEAKFECPQCHKVFTQKAGLQRHIPFHTKEMSYQCDICGKRFLYHTSFNVHKLTHNGNKNFECEECGLAFFSKSHLRRHQKTHLGIKPYKCKICFRGFSEKYNLESHMKVHTREKAHKCSYCNEGFNRKGKMDQHINQCRLNYNKATSEENDCKFLDFSDT